MGHRPLPRGKGLGKLTGKIPHLKKQLRQLLPPKRDPLENRLRIPGIRSASTIGINLLRWVQSLLLARLASKLAPHLMRTSLKKSLVITKS